MGLTVGVRSGLAEGRNRHMRCAAGDSAIGCASRCLEATASSKRHEGDQ